MHLFTWNIKRKWPMVPRALAYLERIAKSDRVIAVFQEWPKTSPKKLPDLGTTSLKYVPIFGKTAVVHSPDLELINCGIDDTKRATIALFRLPNGIELTCVGLHWHSQHSDHGISNACERGGAMALFRHYLEGRLKTNVPAVLMGDFNCDEHEPEMHSPYCLFAVSEKDLPTASSETKAGGHKRPWILVKPQGPALGTFVYRARWRVLDHFVLTPELKKGLIGAQVLTTLEGRSLLTRKKKTPRGGELGSDHLPVLCQIHYQ